MTKKINHCD